MFNTARTGLKSFGKGFRTGIGGIGNTFLDKGSIAALRGSVRGPVDSVRALGGKTIMRDPQLLGDVVGQATPAVAGGLTLASLVNRIGGEKQSSDRTAALAFVETFVTKCAELGLDPEPTFQKFAAETGFWEDVGAASSSAPQLKNKGIGGWFTNLGRKINSGWTRAMHGADAAAEQRANWEAQDSNVAAAHQGVLASAQWQRTRNKNMITDPMGRRVVDPAFKIRQSRAYQQRMQQAMGPAAGGFGRLPGPQPNYGGPGNYAAYASMYG
jgi:hypothetical protein